MGALFAPAAARGSCQETTANFVETARRAGVVVLAKVRWVLPPGGKLALMETIELDVQSVLRGSEERKTLRIYGGVISIATPRALLDGKTVVVALVAPLHKQERDRERAHRGVPPIDYDLAYCGPAFLRVVGDLALAPWREVIGGGLQAKASLAEVRRALAAGGVTAPRGP